MTHRIPPRIYRYIRSDGVVCLCLCLCLCLVLLFGLFSYFGQPTISKSQTNPVIVGNPHATCQRNGYVANQTYSYSLSVERTQRRYLVHTPAEPNFGIGNPTEPRPVVVAFGGKGMSQRTFEQVSQLNQLPALIVYPQPLLGKYHQRAWQGAPYSNQANDIAFVKQVLREVKARFCVNTEAIYSVGFSNGGGFSWLLSCTASQEFRAFAMVAGAYYYPESKCKPAVRRSIMSIHGQRDMAVPYKGSKKRHLPAVENWAMRRAMANRCRPLKPQEQYLSRGVTSQIWENCANHTSVINLTLRNAGHRWPLLTSYVTPDVVSTGEIQTTTQFIWDFFTSTQYLDQSLQPGEILQLSMSLRRYRETLYLPEDSY